MSRYNPVFLLGGALVAALGFVFTSKKADESQAPNSDARQSTDANSVPSSAPTETPSSTPE